jgi:hypothetical protein
MKTRPGFVNVLVLTHALALVPALALVATSAAADPLACDVRAYRALPGLSAALANDTLSATWTGDGKDELRLRFGIVAGAPTIQELAVRTAGGAWGVLASNITPDFRVVSGLRRMSNQQMAPLRGLGVELTAGEVDKYRWDPFWDAPLELGPPSGRSGNPPPPSGVANQPGLPRKSEEITRAAAQYRTTTCEVRTNGARLEIVFPGVEVGVFKGSLQYSIPFNATGRAWVRVAAWDSAGNGVLSQPVKLTKP